MKLKTKLTALLFICLLSMSNINAQTDTPFMGEVKMFAGNFAPRGWAICNGQLLAISSNQALFSILGTTYGGDGRTTFGLPDLRGRVPVSPGRHPGSQFDWRLGQRGGSETNTLTLNNLPAHNHTATVTGITATGTATIAIPASTETGDVIAPGNTVVLSNQEVQTNSNEINAYSAEPADVTLKPFTAPVAITATGGTVTVGSTGNSSAVNNIQPTLALNYIICMQGVYPSRQ